MNTKLNTRAISQNRQTINNDSAGAPITSTQLLSIPDLPKYALIQNKDESPPGRSRSSGSSLRLHPNINRIACKGNRINNKEEIKYNKS